MTVQQLKEAITARPFKPFTVRMADGRSYLVRHPDYISHSPSGRTVIIYEDDDAGHILDLLLMTEIELHPPRKPEEAA